MTEEQKQLFIQWFERVIEAKKVLNANEYVNINGLDRYAGHFEQSNVMLDKVAFKYAVEALNPVIVEELVYDQNNRPMHYRRSFRYMDIEVISIVDVVYVVKPERM